MGNVGIYHIISRLLESLVMFTVGVIVLIFYVLLTILLSPMFLFRFVINKTSRFINPTIGKMMTARGQFVATEQFNIGKPSRSVIIVAIALHGRQSLEEVKRLFIKNLVNLRISNVNGSLKYPELRQFVTTWWGFRFWKPESNFSIDDHIMIYQPKVDIFTDNHLREFMEHLINLPFKVNKSPWEVHVTNKFFDANISQVEMTMVTIRIHHCLADGYGILHTLVENLGSGIPVVPAPRYAVRTSWKQILFNATFPVRMISQLSQFIVVSIRGHPWKIADHEKSWYQLYWKSPIIPVQMIKTIKDKFGVSFTSVLQSAYAAAVRKSLLCLNKSEMKSIPCAMVLPLPNHPKTMRNYCTGAYIHLPVMDCDPIERLIQCDKEVDSAKTSTMPFLGQWLPVLGGSLMTGLSAFLGKNRSFPVAISNFVIGTTQYDLLESKVAHVMIGTGGLPGVTGVNFFVYSYNHGVQFTACAENALMSHQDIERLGSYIVDEIDTMYKLSLV